MYIAPKLRALDSRRFNEIPELLAQRKKDGDAFLKKSEVSALTEWKLKHGTFRPNLANLVASNTDEDILSTTKSAFAMYEADHDSYVKPITALSKLKGIGPATASLLLSCYDPVRIPFFSNELFRYVLWVRSQGKGWDRKMKYNMKEYTEMFEKLQTLQTRLEEEFGEDVSALELEKVAYVLGKEAEPGSTRYTLDGRGHEAIEEVVQPSKPAKKRKKPAAEQDDEPENRAIQQPVRKRGRPTRLVESRT